MAKLEQFIKDHREEFDNREPAEGHFDRFESLLQHQESRTVSFPNRMTVLRAAAVILLIVSLSAVVFDFATRGIRGRFTTSAEHEISDEITEAILYYDRQTSVKLTALGHISSGTDEAEALKLSVVKELQKLDVSTDELKLSLRQNPGNERIQAAIIQNQQMKESILNNVLSQLKNKQNQ